MEKANVETIDNSTIITIQLSGAFYSDLQYVLTHLSEYKTEEELEAVIDKINTEAPSDTFNEWEIAIRTMLILCAEIEAKSRQQNAVKTVEIDIEAPETTDTSTTNI